MLLPCCRCATSYPTCFCSSGGELGAHSVMRLIGRPVPSTSDYYGLSAASLFVRSTLLPWRKNAHSAIRHYRLLRRILDQDTARRAAVGLEDRQDDHACTRIAASPITTCTWPPPPESCLHPAVPQGGY